MLNVAVYKFELGRELPIFPKEFLDLEANYSDCYLNHRLNAKNVFHAYF